MNHGNPDHSRGEGEFNLDDGLRYAVAIGALLVLLLPAARGFSETIGWLPLWLLGMPLTALWARRGFALPRPAVGRVSVAQRRRSAPQARRRSRAVPGRALPRAA